MPRQQFPQDRPNVISFQAVRLLRDGWRRERRQRPVAARLALIGVGTLSVAVGLAGTRLDLLAQLIAGLALLPLSVAAYLCLLPPTPWTDGRDNRWGPGRGGDDHGGPCPSGVPSADSGWDRFEREFRAYVEETRTRSS